MTDFFKRDEVNAIFDKWITALRSGEYEKGTGQLRSSDNTYCCLGVLCEVMEVKCDLVDDVYKYGGNFEKRQRDLPPSVSQSLGMQAFGSLSEGAWCSTGAFPDSNYIPSLVCLNDRFQGTFDEIADFIDKNRGNISSYL